MTDNRPSLGWLLLPIVVGFVTPSLIVFLMEATLGNVSLAGAAGNVAKKQFAEGENLFLLAAIGLVPFLLLSAILIFPFRSAKHRNRVPWLSVAGTIGALAFMVPAHVGVLWPLYTGGDVSSTSAIAYLFIPFIACVPMLLGLAAGFLASRSKVLRTA